MRCLEKRNASVTDRGIENNCVKKNVSMKENKTAAGKKTSTEQRSSVNGTGRQVVEFLVEETQQSRAQGAPDEQTNHGKEGQSTKWSSHVPGHIGKMVACAPPWP